MSKYSDLTLLVDVPSAHKQIIDMIQPSSRVLEIGTNTGYMTRYLTEQLQCEVTGIEIDMDSLVKASPFLYQLLNIDVNNLEQLENSLINNYYDYIIMSDVLEHLLDTFKILNTLSYKIKDRGEIIISMPNANHNIMLMQLLKNDFHYQKMGFLDNTHFRFFTTQSFKKLLLNSRLEIINNTYTYMTPMFEDITHNNYSEFNLFEKEVLLRHDNAHFFQNIFTLKKKSILKKEYNIKNIDAYWFDQIEISFDHAAPILYDIFDENVCLKISLPSNISHISFKPSIRLRGIINLNCYINDNNINCEMSNFIKIDNTYYSFNDTKCSIFTPADTNEDRLFSINFHYVDISENKLRSIFLKASNV
jgi:2-polyprenyl-3-methyl-5-hydroxy-6-metoxy-1,4-benzoquinol methylase